MAIDKYTTPSITARLIGFTGGLNSTAGSLQLSNQESSDLQNIDFDRFGSILKRSGYLNANSSAINSGERITCLHEYALSSGSRYLVTVCGNKVYYWNETSISGAPTDITGAITVTAGNLVSSETFRDTALFTNGVDVPFKWTGTGNCTALTVPTNLTKAKYVCIYQNYTILANVTVSGTDYKSRFYWSNINTVDTWTNTDLIDVSRDDGQTITGIRVLGDKLIIFKDRSIWVAQFTGDADAPFNISKTNSPVGCTSNFSIQEIDNGLVFLSWDGIYFFDGFNSYKVSDKINYNFQNTIARAQLSNAVSMYQHSKNRYWLSVTSSGNSTNNIVITWTKSQTTIGTDAFSIYKGINASVMCMTYTDGITEKPYFGDYSGFVYNADTGVDDYPLGVKTAIDAYYYTNWITYDDLCDQKSTLSVYLYYLINSSNLNFVYSYDFNSNDTYSQSINMSDGGALWGSVTWGNFIWASAGGKQQRIDISGRGRVIRFGFKNSSLSQQFRIDGLGSLTYSETHV